MRAWVVDRPSRMRHGPLDLATKSVPEPAPDEVLVRVRACGICRTDLHLAEGDLPPRRRRTVPGHQVVGEVSATGDAVDRFAIGDRVGIAWLRNTCGHCRFCRAGRENLCPRSLYTGWDADGGLAEYAVVPQAFAYRLPDTYDDEQVAPLLCSGIIGYRALERARVPSGGRLGIYGFGSSAHITAQIATARGAELYVMTRGEGNQRLARELGAAYVAGPTEHPPAELDSAIVFAPAGELVPLALRALGPGGTVSLAGIHLSDVPSMTYADHLFGERDLRSVTSNTRQDGEELLRLAARLQLDVHTTAVGFDEVADALTALADGRTSGSLVMVAG
ncbi:zinc-dependent alcohol dehydrogenase family protein [Nocardioidaceae bacterium SCSIO 66511]|nr:zinc-dependent alcohol dehydrogenase family protein [Nocardioidaceae bacterium SCSIO 66511]